MFWQDDNEFENLLSDKLAISADKDTLKEQVQEDIEAIAKAGEETKVTVGAEILAEKDTTIKENHMSMLTLSLKKPEKKQKLKLMKMLKK